jgi:hypothetical protein
MPIMTREPLRAMMEYRGIYDYLDDIRARKRHDYGDSFGKLFSEFGIISAVVRIADKVERLKTLCRCAPEVEETMRDTLIDLANYAIMTVFEISKKEVIK